MKQRVPMMFAATLAAALAAGLFAVNLHAQEDSDFHGFVHGSIVLSGTSTISQNGDNGADPNKLVKVTDRIAATQPASAGNLDRFVTIRSARAGQAFRGVALAPERD